MFACFGFFSRATGWCWSCPFNATCGAPHQSSLQAGGKGCEEHLPLQAKVLQARRRVSSNFLIVLSQNQYAVESYYNNDLGTISICQIFYYIREAVVAERLRPQTFIPEVLGLNPGPAVAPLSKAHYPHWLVFRRSLNPNQPGLFWRLSCPGGGADSTPFRSRPWIARLPRKFA